MNDVLMRPYLTRYTALLIKKYICTTYAQCPRIGFTLGFGVENSVRNSAKRVQNSIRKSALKSRKRVGKSSQTYKKEWNQQKERNIYLKLI